MPFRRTVAGRTVVNAGSVGLPYGTGGAHWLWLDGPYIHPRVTAYDAVAAARRIGESDYPGAADFADGLQNVPGEAEALAFFTALEPAQYAGS